MMLAFWAAALIFAVPIIASGETVPLLPSKDNTLYEDSKGSLSDGKGAYLFVGSTRGASKRRALLSFPVNSIPSGAIINTVQLTLNVSKTIAGSQAITLHRVLKDWGEGTSDASGEEGRGAPVSSGDATWIHNFYNTNFWTSPGGDFSPGESALQTVGSQGNYTWGSTPGMVADVQAWVNNPTSNFGWLLKGNESASTTTKRFDSRESTDLTKRPVLTVTYTLPIHVMPQIGDVNGDGFVTMADAILALKITASLDVSGENITLDSDVNGDGKINMAELIYIMHRLAGLR